MSKALQRSLGLGLALSGALLILSGQALAPSGTSACTARSRSSRRA